MPGPAAEDGPAEEEYRPLLFSIAYGMRSALWSIPTSLVISDRCLMWRDCRGRNYRNTDATRKKEETDERAAGHR